MPALPWERLVVMETVARVTLCKLFPHERKMCVFSSSSRSNSCSKRRCWHSVVFLRTCGPGEVCPTECLSFR